MTATINTLSHILNASVALLLAVTQAIGQGAVVLVDLAKNDTRVRWGLGAGASVLLSAGVLGLGGSLVPDFSQASGIPGAPVIKEQGVVVVDMSTSTVYQIIESLPKAQRYELMLYNSGVDEVLKQKGSYTVFVPASAYFDYLPKRYIAMLSRAQMKDLTLGHIVSRALPIEESLNGDVITLGDTLVAFEVVASQDKIYIGEANVLHAYKASNGMVYIIDKVLVDSVN